MNHPFARLLPALIPLAAACVNEPVEPSPASLTASIKATTQYEAIDLGQTLVGPIVVDNGTVVYGAGLAPDASRILFRWQDGVSSTVGSVPSPSSISAISPGGVAGGVLCQDQCFGSVTTAFVIKNGQVLERPLGFTALFGRAIAVGDDATLVVAASGGRTVMFDAAGARTSIEPLLPGGFLFVESMNKHHELTGSTSAPGYRDQRAMIYDGTVQALPELEPQPCSDNPAEQCSRAVGHAINDNGDVAGQSTDAEGFSHAVLWPKAGGIVVLPGFNAQYMNNRSQILFTNEFGNPALWDNGQVQDITGLGSSTTQVFSLNDHGEVAGISRSGLDGRFHAFVWANGTTIDLGSGPGNFAQAMYISDQGDVVGFFRDANFASRAMLWRRVRD